MKQADRVDGSPLPEAIDPADALFETQRIPRQLDIDDEPAAMVQVEAFTGGIGRDEHVEPALVERVDRVAPRSAAGRRECTRHASAGQQAPRRSRRACRGTQ